MYLYTGLSRALTQFILTNNPSEDKDDEIDIENLSVVSSALDQKLLDLMKKKGVTMLSFKNIDETIAIISDKMVERFVYAIEEVTNSED